MTEYSNPDLFSFSPDSGDDISDIDTQNDDVGIGVEYASSDDQIEASSNGALFEFQTMQGMRGNQYRQEYTEIKEQMYQDKLAHLKNQLKQLNDATLPEYSKRLRRIEGTYRERMRISTVIRDLEEDMVEQDFINEKRSAVREFEEQKVFLRDQLISELEDKQRLIEAERHNMELTGDLNGDLKPISTRKLRRRPNEGGYGSTGYSDKRNGTGGGRGGKQPCNVSNLNYLLQEQEVNEDLKIINKNRAYSSISKSVQRLGSTGHTISGGDGVGSSGYISTENSRSRMNTYPKDCRIEEGKLFYEKRWYRRGQSIQLESSKSEKFPAMISAIGSESIMVRKLNDSGKLKIYLKELTKGKYIIKRRAV
jgi:Sin3 histone deacetylase corepressor complex component SDS3